jgi:hypothetical protein
MSKKPYRPSVPVERLKAMEFALVGHIYAGEIVEAEPLTKQMAVDILDVVQSLIRGPRRPPRYRKEDLRAAAIARDIIRHFGVPQEEAVAVAFDNPDGLDVQSLARKYRNLRPKLAESEWSVTADPNMALAAYYRTPHYKNRKAGKVKGK